MYIYIYIYWATIYIGQQPMNTTQRFHKNPPLSHYFPDGKNHSAFAFTLFVPGKLNPHV